MKIVPSDTTSQPRLHARLAKKYYPSLLFLSLPF